VKVTVPVSSRPSSMQAPPKPEDAVGKTEKVDKVEEEPRRLVITGNDSKYLQSLGIKPTILDERSEIFTNWLDFFGWVPGDQMRIRHLDDMATDLDREINKAQAGGWLARFEEEDERVGAIKSGIDLAITECEELDNLLTLYSVELSVSCPQVGVSPVVTNLYRHSPTISITSKPKDRVFKCRQPTRSY
jgi:exocyst complex component 1